MACSPWLESVEKKKGEVVPLLVREKKTSLASLELSRSHAKIFRTPFNCFALLQLFSLTGLHLHSIYLVSNAITLLISP